MANKFSNIKERALEIAVNHNIAKEKFCEQIGMTYGSFKGEAKKTPLNSDAIENILTIYSDVDAGWLLTGEGKMFKSKRSDLLNNETKPYQTNQNGIPLLEAEAAAGFGTGTFTIKEEDILARYQVPAFEKMDFMIPIRGTSMYPRYKSGDIVGCRIVREHQFIQWNRAYVIATREQGIICKRIKPSAKEGYYLAVSDNQDYDPFEIPKDEITGLALVVGVVRVE